MTPIRKSFPKCEGSSSSDDNSLPVTPVGDSHDSGHYSGRGGVANQQRGVTNQQRCVCEAALQRVNGDKVFYRCDPHDPSKFLTCARGSVTVHSCPRNLFWNGQSNGCSLTKACRPVPSSCNGGTPTSPGICYFVLFGVVVCVWFSVWLFMANRLYVCLYVYLNAFL